MRCQVSGFRFQERIGVSTPVEVKIQIGVGVEIEIGIEIGIGIGIGIGVEIGIVILIEIENNTWMVGSAHPTCAETGNRQEGCRKPSRFTTLTPET